MKPKLVLSTLPLLCSLVLAPSSASAEDEIAISETASHHFNEGVRHLTTDSPNRYQRAYREFKAAYRDSPSWKISGNLGIVAMELERDGEAIAAFEEYLRKGGNSLDAQERKQFERDLELLRKGHGTLTIRCDSTPCWVVDERLPSVGEAVINRYGPFSEPESLAVRAGHHRVQVERAGFHTDVWELDIEAGASETHLFALHTTQAERVPPASHGVEPSLPPGAEPTASSSSRLPAYLTLGAGMLSAAAGGVLYALAIDKQNEADEIYERECSLQPARCGQNVPQDREARNLNVAGSIATGAGVVGIGIGIYLLLSDDGVDTGELASGRFLPMLGLDRVGLSGTF